jgi:hypothetical protein
MLNIFEICNLLINSWILMEAKKEQYVNSRDKKYRKKKKRTFLTKGERERIG